MRTLSSGTGSSPAPKDGVDGSTRLGSASSKSLCKRCYVKLSAVRSSVPRRRVFHVAAKRRQAEIRQTSRVLAENDCSMIVHPCPDRASELSPLRTAVGLDR